MCPNQYTLNGDELIIRVKKAPLFVRSLFFLFAFLFFLMPVTVLILVASEGQGIHFGFFIGIFIFWVLGFYLLKIALWNTYGQEIITFKEKHIGYVADYGWFKDGKKELEIQKPFTCSVNHIGYEEDNVGTLVIEGGVIPIHCVAKVPVPELEEISKKIQLRLQSMSHKNEQ